MATNDDALMQRPDECPENGALLLADLAHLFRRFLALAPYVAETLALWVLHTWVFDTWVFDACWITPRVVLRSPDMRCGKSTLLRLLAAVVREALASANITAASAFRLIDAIQPTVLIDEGDSFLKKDSDVRNILSSGHCRHGAVVHRAVGKTETRALSIFAPVAIAGIGSYLWATVEDRSIVIDMRRALPGEVVEHLRLDRFHQGCDPLRRRCARWAEANLPALEAADPETPAELNDRAQDNWRFLLAIADLAGGEWPVTARAAARALSASDGETSVRAWPKVTVEGDAGGVCGGAEFQVTLTGRLTTS